MSVIEMTDVGKRYGDFQALDGLSLAVGRGELFGLLGPNGAGKTTAIGLLTGQLAPDEGTLSVLGTDPATEPIETRRRVGIVPEKESPPSFLTPREYFDFVGQVRGIPEDRLANRVQEWADRLAFTDKLDAISTDLSRGQQQKVMITQAFLHDPEAVFIDEPLANLDPIMQERVKAYFEEYRAQDNALLLSTHGIEVARELCDRVGVVRDGRLVAERRPADMRPDESLLDAFESDGTPESTEPVTQ